MGNGEKAMKNMKYMIFGITLVCVILFTACDNILDPPESSTRIDYGKISINFTGWKTEPQAARTVLPSMVFDKYVYTFTKAGETTGVKLSPDNEGFFTLEAGNYTVEVQAFIGNAEPYTLAATGVSSQFSVVPGNNEPVKIALSIVAAGAQGKFSYTITYPADATAEITLQKWPNLDDITLNPSINQWNGKTNTETLQLDTGSYLLTVLVNKTGLYAGMSEAVLIYPLLVTEYTKNFDNTDLLTYPTPITTDFTITGTTFTYDGSPKSVTIEPKSNKSTGTITIFYNGSDTAPVNAGTYTVTFNVAAVEGWRAANGLPAGTLTIDRADGAAVDVPANTTSVSSSVIETATVTAPANGQQVEYAISTSTSAPSSGWQNYPSFSGLTSGTTYYIFARSEQNTNYNAGPVSGRLTATTKKCDVIVLYPRGQLSTYVGAPNNEKIQFRAEARLSNGTVINNASGFVYDNAGVNSSGVFTPQTAGDVTITVSLDGVTASATVKVYPADYMRQPYYYPGTGKTYQGFSGGTTGNRTTNSGGVTVTYPAQTTFSADGFFTLEGYVNNSAVYNYAYIQLSKDSDSTNLKTTYLVRDNFKQRIWLRFGAGDYTVSIHGLSSITLSSQLGAEGDYRGCSYQTPGITFNVTNTRNDDSSIDYSIPDKRFIYPSYVVQSDDFRVTNLAADLTYGLTDNTAKIKAIHDYIVTNTIYDHDSLEDGWRKKQDALTVLGTRYHINSQYNPVGHFLAVCEGYANTFAALARAAGIEVRYASSIDMNHAWNHVYNDGWKFIDVTWDDPSPDRGPTYVRYTYYLLTSLYGVNNDHYGWEINNGRSLIGSTIPRQRGVPDGWY